MYYSNFSTPLARGVPTTSTPQLLYPIERIDFTLLQVKLRSADAALDVQIFALTGIRAERTIFS